MSKRKDSVRTPNHASMGPQSRYPGADEFVRGGSMMGRESFMQSPITVRRRANPDNPEMANFQPNMVFDYTHQKADIPTRLSSHNDKPERTTNVGGVPALGLPHIVVGSGEDDKGNY